jgi:YD repeat-containing protein
MGPEFSRRGWFRGLFAALLGYWARPLLQDGVGVVPTAGCDLSPLSSGLTYMTYVGGQTTTHVYDAAGRLCATIDGDAGACTYTYDANGDRA